jgi:hypothetical protein
MNMAVNHKLTECSQIVSEAKMNPVGPENCADHQKETSDRHPSRRAVWVAFCEKYGVAENSELLFDCDEAGFVRTREIGNPRPRKLLRRSAAMEAMMCEEARKAVACDGIIYIMHTGYSDGVIVPRYIGKSETAGKTSGVPSVNLLRLETDKSKFGRWGDNYAYHIGDLSSVVLPGHEIAVPPLKYQHWAQELFEGINVERPRLRQPVFLWVKAWQENEIGPWQEFGPTHLSFLEYLLIGLASALFPSKILNREGRNRGDSFSTVSLEEGA